LSVDRSYAVNGRQLSEGRRLALGDAQGEGHADFTGALEMSSPSSLKIRFWAHLMRDRLPTDSGETSVFEVLSSDLIPNSKSSEQSTLSQLKLSTGSITGVSTTIYRSR
jgi:hypothetical protein